MGRHPEEDESRDVTIAVRLTAAERAKWESAAQAKELTLSAWVRMLARKAMTAADRKSKR